MATVAEMRRVVAPLKERHEANKAAVQAALAAGDGAAFQAASEQFELTKGMYIAAMEPVFVAAEQERERRIRCNNAYGCTLEFAHDDGGRAQAGFKGSAGDCVVRAFCILTGADYGEAYKEFAHAQSVLGSGRHKRKSARDGIHKAAYEHVFKMHGLQKVKLGRGIKPTWSQAHEHYGDCIVSTRKHLCAITGGAVRDTHDQRGYWWSERYQENLGTDYDAMPKGGGEVEWRERKAMSVWVQG